MVERRHLVGQPVRPADNTYHIFRLDLATQSWVDTGTPLDDRPSSKADTLWDGQKLYVASHIFTNSGAPTSSPSQWGRLYRYSYNAGHQDLQPRRRLPRHRDPRQIRDAGAGEGAQRPAVGHLCREQQGHGQPQHRQRQRLGHAVRAAGQRRIQPRTTTISPRSSPSTAAPPRPKVGVLWSNQNDKKMYFATHLDGAAASRLEQLRRVWCPPAATHPPPTTISISSSRAMAWACTR